MSHLKFDFNCPQIRIKLAEWHISLILTLENMENCLKTWHTHEQNIQVFLHKHEKFYVNNIAFHCPLPNVTC